MTEAERLLAAALACLPPGTVAREDCDEVRVARWTAGEQWLTVSVGEQWLVVSPTEPVSPGMRLHHSQRRIWAHVETVLPSGERWADSWRWGSESSVYYHAAADRQRRVAELVHGALRRMTGTTDEDDERDDRARRIWLLAMACAAAEAGVIPMDDPRIHETAAELGVTVERLDQPAGTDRQRRLFDD